MDKKTTYFIFFVMSILFILVYSTSTSFLYSANAISVDPGVYQTIAYSWVKGAVPYRDLFDQKGPIIYFVNALGFLLTGSRYGTSIIQILCIFFSMVYCHKLLLIEYKEKYAFLGVVFVLISLILSYDSGNMVEEYILPLLFMSFYYSYKWFKNFETNGESHIGWYLPFLFGLVLGFSFLTRLTNALGVCLLAFTMLIILISKSDYKAIFKCIAWYFLGALSISIPFLIYFYCKDSLYDMWYCSIIFNIKYANKIIRTETPLYTYILAFSTSWILSIISLVALIKCPKNKLINCVSLFLGLVTTIYFFIGRGYPHYAMIALPYICIYFNIYKISLNSLNKTILRLCQFSFFIIVCAYTLHAAHLTYSNIVHSSCIFHNDLFHNKYKLFKGDVVYHEYLDIIKPIPHNEYDNMIAVNCSIILPPNWTPAFC